MNRMLVMIALLGVSPADSEIDLVLDRNQWETLKALGAPDADQRPVDRQAIARLVSEKLAEMWDDRPVITPMGRKAVVRGSPSLWDISG
ncbi:MAG: hypothetical protein Q8L22_14880 [Reyranella sp.]|nr:hypothetical protein [Reyranella sp.]